MNTALLRKSPNELAQQLGIRFDESFDDLDYLEIAWLRIDHDTEFALVRHRGLPIDETEVWLQARNWNQPNVLAKVLTALEASSSDLLWRLPLEFPLPT